MNDTAFGFRLSAVGFRLATATGVLGLASLAAAFIPAWRAAGNSPSTAIRATD